MKKENRSLFAQIIVLLLVQATGLLCLPALLVTIGATGVLISLFSNIPFLITIVKIKKLFSQ